MKINIKKVASLAKLSLTSSEEKKFKKELSNILDYMSVIGEVNTKNVPVTSQSTGLVGKEREDVVSQDPIHHIQEELLSASQYKEGRYIKVPPVF